jgi:ZIP family zinc transporter
MGVLSLPDGASLFLLGSFASLAAGLGTGVGAIPVFFMRGLSPASEDTLMGAAAGVMLAAASFSLLVPALEIATADAASYGLPWLGAIAVCLGLLAGGGGFWLIHCLVPHEHFIKGREGGDAIFARRLWLFVMAITLHNFPEGLAVGAGFGAPELSNGWVLTAGIALQNLPEGLIVALALVNLGYSVTLSFAVSVVTGLVEPVGGMVGAAAAAYAQAILPWALAFAAGAMLFVVGGEMIPETHRRGHETRAKFGLMAGFALMIGLGAEFG